MSAAAQAAEDGRRGRLERLGRQPSEPVQVPAALAFGAIPTIAKTVKIGVPTFLTGAGAPAFGIPGKNGVELIVRGINNGELPAPYNTKGLAGRQIEALIYDEAGGGTKQVTELRNKVQKDNNTCLM